MNDNKSRVASKVVADFLAQPARNVACSELSGGSEEGTIFKCSYENASYVIKFFTKKEAGENEIAWTKHAGDLGIGSKLYYADPDGTYMITQFEQGSSLTPDTVNAPAIIKGIALNLARLHHSSASFAHEGDMFKRIATKYEKLQASGPLKDLLERDWLQVKKIGSQIKNVNVPLVPCHNDLNWGNIFINDYQVTFIDWGDAALANPYFDVAAFLVLNLITPENENVFFHYYDEQLSNAEQKAYVQLLKQLVYFEFALNLLLGVQESKKELLHLQEMPTADPVGHYLTLLAKKEVDVNASFLYTMAVASLNQIRLHEL